MASEWVLFRATSLKAYWLLRRYLANTIGFIVGLYALFALLFFGGSAAAPSVVEGSLGAIVVGYFLWTIAIRAYTEIASGISSEAQWGTLEQLHLTPYGISRVLLYRTIANLALSFLLGFVILLSIMVTTWTWFSVDLLTVLTVVPLAVLTILPVVGFGLLFGGLALLYKRVESLASLMQLVFIPLLGLPLEAHAVVPYLPLTLGSTMIEESMTAGVLLWQFPATEFGILLLTVVLYLGGGFGLFHVLQTRARRRGVLGHY